MSNVIDSIKVSGTVYTLSAQTEGGGKAIEAGRGISVTTGETADTVSFNLPIYSGTGINSIKIGNPNRAQGTNSVAIGADGVKADGIASLAGGSYSEAKQSFSIAYGRYVQTNNYGEASFGFYNKTNGSSGNYGNSSGNTLFSVGNGTGLSSSARHNAFEIRQNGDIYLTSGGTDIKLQDHLGGGGSVTVDTELDSGSTNPVQNKVIYNKIDEVEQVTAAALNELNDTISGKVDTSTYNTYTATTDTALNGKQATLVSGTNIKTINNESILGSGNITIQGGPTYTAGRGISLSNNTISVSLPISAGTGADSVIEGNASNKASGNTSHAEGSSTRANGDYSHAEGINTKANGSVSHAEGNSTITNGFYSHAEGNGTTASGYASHAEGSFTKANDFYSHAEGYYTTANNQSEHASGQYNVSSSGSSTFGDSGNTLFSVGNGTATNARHNAFEIRQNGDIYLSSGGTDIKLQDHLGGSSITVDTELDSGSTNPVENRVIYNKFDEVEQVTAAGLNAVNDKFDGLKLKKLTQVEYDALSGSTDANTLYVIVN